MAPRPFHAAKRMVRARTPEALLDRWHDFRLQGLEPPIRVGRPDSLVTTLNLMFLQDLVHRIGRLEIPGDIVETGVYRGGSAGVLGYEMLRGCGGPRRLWLFDSFAGMPEAGPHDDELSHRIEGQYVGSERRTRRILRRLDVPDSAVRIVVGRFEETFERTQTPSSVALLHVDCDFHDPVRLTLEKFYPAMPSGGYVVLNDYGAFAGCRRATDDFLTTLGEPIEPIFIDRSAAFFQKPGGRFGRNPVTG